MKTFASFTLCFLLMNSFFAIAQHKVPVDPHEHDVNEAAVNDPYYNTLLGEKTHYSYKSTDPMGNPVTVVLDPPVFAKGQEFDELEHERFDSWEMDESEEGNAKASVTIDAYIWADEELRAARSNYHAWLDQVVETADNAYWRDFQIHWQIRKYWAFHSEFTDAQDLLYKFADLCDRYEPNNGLMMGFTKDPRFGPNVGGIAYVYTSDPGQGVSVTYDQGTSATIYALRHEIGHNFGCYHDYQTQVCMMNYAYAYSVDYFHSGHRNVVNANRNWFQ